MLTKTTDYKGHPMFVIMKDENDRFPFQFGVSKAKKIVETIEEIKKFVQENQTAEDVT